MSRVGHLSGTLGAGSLDVIMCISVLEHLWDPQVALTEFRRLTAPGGVCLFNVPSWRGKRFLEFSAFRLGFSPREASDSPISESRLVRQSI